MRERSKKWSEAKMYKRGNKKKFSDFVYSVKSDPHRYLYIKNTLNRLKEEDIDINTQNASGNTLLHLAIKMNDLKLFNIFLDSGVNVNLANDNGDAPIHKAVLDDKILFVKSLVEHGCDLNLGTELEQTPLHLAVTKGNLEMVKYLVENGADILLMDEINNLPIDYAIDEKDEKMIKYFMDKQTLDEARKMKVDIILNKGVEKNDWDI